MDDPEDEQHAILLDDVVHDPVVADPEPMKGVRNAPDRLHGLASDPSGLRRIGCELLESPADPGSHLWGQLLERPNGRGGQLDFVGLQPRSSRLVVRPFA